MHDSTISPLFILGPLPKPYFEQDGIAIYHGDCRDILPLFHAGSVDLVLADPPYGETSLDWDTPVQSWSTEVERVLSDAGSMWCFGSFRFFMEYRDEIMDGWKLAQEIVWEKHNGSIFHADRFRRVHELVAQFYPAGTPWGEVYKSPQFTMDGTKRTIRRKGRPPHAGLIGDGNYTSNDGGPRMMRSVQSVRSCHGYAVHPTQKPEGIIRPLLAYSLPPGGIVLDPFMGSGTTLAVAKQHGHRAIGIEISEEYCAKAVTRLQQSVLPLEAS